MGSALHIVLDDVNIEDHHIAWCIEETIPKLTDPREKWACVNCARLLLKASLDVREKIVGGYGRDWE